MTQDCITWCLSPSFQAYEQTSSRAPVLLFSITEFPSSQPWSSCDRPWSSARPTSVLASSQGSPNPMMEAPIPNLLVLEWCDYWNHWESPKFAANGYTSCWFDACWRGLKASLGSETHYMLPHNSWLPRHQMPSNIWGQVSSYRTLNAPNISSGKWRFPELQ